MTKECANCFSNYSSQWRKINNVHYCNACAIFYRRKGYFIPVEEIYAKILLSLKKNNNN